MTHLIAFVLIIVVDGIVGFSHGFRTAAECQAAEMVAVAVMPSPVLAQCWLVRDGVGVDVGDGPAMSHMISESSK